MALKLSKAIDYSAHLTLAFMPSQIMYASLETLLVYHVGNQSHMIINRAFKEESRILDYV